MTIVKKISTPEADARLEFHVPSRINTSHTLFSMLCVNTAYNRVQVHGFRHGEDQVSRGFGHYRCVQDKRNQLDQNQHASLMQYFSSRLLEWTVPIPT
jgi:hypothetical protein